MIDRIDPDCAAVRDKLSAFLDGQLHAASRRALQDHIRGCDGCLHELRALRRLSALTASRPLPAVRPDLEQRVRAELARRRQSTAAGLGAASGLRRHRVAMLVAAALLVGAAVGWGFGAAFSTPDETPTPNVAVETGDPTSRTPVEAVEKARLARLEAEGLQRFTRAARTVLADLALIEGVDTSLRRTLIAEQLAAFDLVAKSERLLSLELAEPEAERLRPVAQFLLRLHRDVADRATAFDGIGLRDSLLERGLLADLGPDRPAGRPVGAPDGLAPAVSGDRLARADEETATTPPVAGDRTEAFPESVGPEAEAMAVLLAAKRRWVEDGDADPARLLETLGPLPAGGLRPGLVLSLRGLLADSLAAKGRTELSIRLMVGTDGPTLEALFGASRTDEVEEPATRRALADIEGMLQRSLEPVDPEDATPRR